MDDADRAQAHMDEINRLSDEERASRPVLTADDSADNCEECGDQIPSARQIAVPGVSMCVECAGNFEKKRL